MSDNEVTTVGANPMTLIEMAIEKDLSIEKLTQLFDLKERWDAGEASKSFKRAMVEFQGKKPSLVKSAKVNYKTKAGGITSYNFAPLPKIQKQIDSILSECGLSYSWKQEQINGNVKITCIVSHIDGHTEETTLEAPNDTSGNKNAIQSIGSSVSYLKRYTLEGALGLSSDNDDDGASQKKKAVKIDPKEVGKATKVLNSCTSLEELQAAYMALPKIIQSVKQVIDLKDSLKNTLK